MSKVLLQDEIVGQVEAINAEVLGLVRLVCHLASHSLRAVVYSKLNVSLLRVDLSHVEQSLSVARFKDIKLHTTVDNLFDFSSCHSRRLLYRVVLEQVLVEWAETWLIRDLSAFVFSFTRGNGCFVGFNRFSQIW